MSVWTGLENALPNADMCRASSRRPTSSSSSGRSGASTTRPRAAPASRSTCPRRRSCSTCSRPGGRRQASEERARIWHEMLGIHAEQVFTIGIVRAVPQPVVVSNRLRNVPKEGRLQLGARRLLRHLPPGDVLVRRRHCQRRSAVDACSAGSTLTPTLSLSRVPRAEGGALRSAPPDALARAKPGEGGPRKREGEVRLDVVGPEVGAGDAQLPRPAPPDDDPDAARDQRLDLRHHPAAARRLPLELHRRAAGPGRGGRPARRSSSCASNTASTRPMVEQYAVWVLGLLQGDLGYSFEYNRPVSEVVGDRLLLTMVLNVATILFIYLVVLPDRRLFGHPPVQLGRPRPHLPRLPRPRHAQLPARADPDVPRQRAVRHLDRRR